MALRFLFPRDSGRDRACRLRLIQLARGYDLQPIWFPPHAEGRFSAKAFNAEYSLNKMTRPRWPGQGKETGKLPSGREAAMVEKAALFYPGISRCCLQKIDRLWLSSLRCSRRLDLHGREQRRQFHGDAAQPLGLQTDQFAGKFQLAALEH